MKTKRPIQYPKQVAALSKTAWKYHQSGQLELAEATYKELLNRYPKVPEAKSLLALVLGELGRYAEAVEWINKAIVENPAEPSFHNNLGALLVKMGEDVDAEKSFRTAIGLQNDYRAGWLNLAEMQSRTGRISDAVESYEKVLEIDPADAAVWSNMASDYSNIGDIDNAMFCYQTASRICGDPLVLLSNALFASNYDHRLSVSERVSMHMAAGKMIEERAGRLEPPPSHPTAGADGRLRIGFVSGDFKYHPVGYFVEGVLKNIDRNRFDIRLYSTIRYEDALTTRIKANCDGWTCLLALDDDAAAKVIRDDEVAVLFDLAGHTGQNRLGIFARKPAPIQVSWLGYYATTGLSAMDYVLVDPYLCKPEWQDQFSEELMFLPKTRLCFTPPEDGPEIVRLPALQNGRITFGCFNNLAKVNGKVVEVWARVLLSVPDSRLMLKSKGLADAPTRERVTKHFSSLGVDAGRLILEGWSQRGDYLATYNQVDITLDPFPFAGATTSVESLWMGVPVLTMMGDTLVSCQGASLMKNLALDDWVAADEDAYVALAARHAKDLARLAALRASLRTRLLASPLCDAGQFAQDLANAITEMAVPRSLGREPHVVGGIFCAKS